MLRRLIVASLSLVVAAAGAALVAPSASAGDTLHCRGFTSCASKGYSSAGFNKVYKESFWRATAGHNCTNYVAYRLTHNGRMTALPEGMASAWRWGIAAKENGILVTGTPQVGDVAWWDLTTNVGAGTGGHVAYVERVYSNGSIKVSEDNYGGDFDWRTLTKGHAWPTGFIRYPKSDGSPSGRTTSASIVNPDTGQVTVTGYATEADNYVASELGFTFQRADASREPYVTTATRTGQWSITRTFGAGHVPDSVSVMVGNTAGTLGSSTAFNEIPIAATPYVAPPIRYGVRMERSFADSTIRKRDYPYMYVTVHPTDPAQPWPTGKVVIRNKDKVLTTTILYASQHGRLKIRLPKHARGTHYLDASYEATSPSVSDVAGALKLSVRS